MKPVLCNQSGKIRYDSRLEAQEARAHWRRQARRNHLVARKVPLEIYECPHCNGGFHLTKKLKGQR